MILYYSGTGDTTWVAQRIADVANDDCVSISDLVNGDNYQIALKRGEPLGIVSPTSASGLPDVVTGFLSKMQVKDAGYCFFVGTVNGLLDNIFHIGGLKASWLLRKRGLHVSRSYFVHAPVAHGKHGAPRSESKRNQKAFKEIDRMLNKMLSR